MNKYDYISRHHYLSEKGDGTLTLMCALSLCLLAFFAVLNSMSKKDDLKLRLALGSFVGSLGILPGGMQPSMEKGGVLLLKSAPIIDKNNDLANKRINLKSVTDLINYTSTKKWCKILRLKKSSEGVTVHLSSQAFFALGSADLLTQNLNILDRISNLIRESSCNVLIKGHTDNIPISSGKYTSNWELSAARTMSVLTYFLKQGIPLSQLEASGYGEYNPLFPNDTPEHRAINRRVEIQLIQKEETPVLSKDMNVKGFLFKMRSLKNK